MLHQDPFNLALQQELSSKKSQLYDTQACEEFFLAQNASADWLQLCDANNRFFHAQMRERRAASKVVCLIGRDGRKLLLLDDIKNEFLHVFQSLLQSRTTGSTEHLLEVTLNGPILSSNQTQYLTRPLQMEEIKQALFDMAPNKLPEPDGFTVVFFQKHWDLIRA